MRTHDADVDLAVFSAVRGSRAGVERNHRGIDAARL